MSTIGDQFAELAALFGGEGEAPSKTPPEADIENQPEVDAEADDDVERPVPDSLESVVATTICELTGLPADDFPWDADLASLDMEGLPLWALVAEVERFRGENIPDAVVHEWKSPRDIISDGAVPQK